MVEIPKRVLRDLQFVLVEQIDEVLDAALLPPVEPPVSARKRARNVSRKRVPKKK
jgi:ATP-dependent Lon protease